MRPRACLVFAFAVTGLLAPAVASAQWYLASFTGANATRPASVTIDQPALGRVLTFPAVRFEARPFERSPYYGARLGHFFAGSHFGWEVEFLHVKMIGRTDQTVRITGREAGLPIDVTAPMRAFVQRYNMTHGLNFVFANLVARVPASGSDAGRPVALVFRAGAGPVIPGADSIVDRRQVNSYQYSGFGGHAAAGVDVRLWRWVSAMVEYKVTAARPRIAIDRGTGRTTALTHHVAAGLAAGFRRR